MTVVRRIFVVALILLSVGMSAEGKVSETILPNGLKVLIKEVHSAPVFTSQVWYKVGSRNEHTGITGASHLLEHMMFKGTKTYGKGEFTRLIKSKGGMENAATWVDFTYYWELLSSDHLELALKLEADRMQNSLFDPREFDAERTVVRSELEGKENHPFTLLYQGIHASAYTAHPYRWPIIGWLSDVENVPRDAVYNYYRTYYKPNNATLVIVGDVDTEKTLELVRKYFGKIPRGPEPPEVYTKEPPQQGERRFTIRRQGAAERVMVAYHIPEIIHPDTYPLMMLDQILSAGKSSRLYQVLVEGRLATSTWSTASSRKDSGLFILSATGLDGVSAAQLEKALLEEVEKMKSVPPTSKEMEQATNQLEAYLVFQNDSVSGQGEQLGTYETIASWKYLDTLLPRIMGVTPEDVQRVAREYLREENRTVGWFVPTGPPSGGKRGAPGLESHLQTPLGIAPNYTPAAKRTAPTPAIDTQTVKPKRTVLKNGMVVIVQENHSNRTVAIRGNLKAGGYFDPVDKKGLAAFTAEMLTRGTNRRSALDIAQETDYVGASIGTGSDTETATFSAKGLSKDFNLLLDILSDEIRRPSFPEEQIEKVKGEMTSQLDQEKENPRDRAMREFNRSVFPPGHPLRPQTIEEDQASIRSITRDDLVKFHQTYYGPETAAIVIVGDVTAEDAVAAVEKYFGDWKPTEVSHKIDIPRTPLAAKSSKEIIPMTDKSQVDVVFGHSGQLARTDPDFYAATVMNHILGGGAGLDSRLGKLLREDMGLVYYVYSWFDASLGAGPWQVSFGTNPANTDKAVDAAQEEIRHYIDAGPTEKEFDDAIDYIVGVFPIRLETNDGVANVLLAAEFYGLGIDYIERYPSIYRSVTIKQVRAAAKKYLHPDRTSLVVAGPYGG